MVTWPSGRGAHQGPPKTAQRYKVLADAFKLTWISITMYPRPRLILCLSDPLAARPFLPGARSWAARAFQDSGVTIAGGSRRNRCALADRRCQLAMQTCLWMVAGSSSSVSMQAARSAREMLKQCGRLRSIAVR